MTLNLHLPEDLRERLNRRAAESGYSNIEDYAQAVLRADIEDDLLPEDVEELLLERMRDLAGSIELTPEYMARFRAEVEKRRSGGR